MAFFALALAAVFLISPLAALVAYARVNSLQRELEDVRVQVKALRSWVDRQVKAPAPAPPAVPITPPEVASVTTPAVSATSPPPSSVPVRAATTPRPAASMPLPPVPPRPRPPITPPPSSGDFATNRGPRILVAGSALAFMVFTGLLVKYAWDNNWVGPTGRVLLGALVGLGLLMAGSWLMGGKYRPLGQGLSAAGLVGLYSSAYGAHGFYHLISRGASGALMVIITACAVLLAARLDARLLAALAWIGGYMTPLLLSTGEDKAVSLFLFLAVLDAGALVLDRFKPWPETIPLAGAGTVLLYVGWYAQFFRPERFGVAAFGLVLFTALFALGMAPRKERDAGLGAVFAMAGLGLSVLAGGADRPEVLVVLGLALGAAAMAQAARVHWAFALAAAFAMGLPFMTWCAAFYRPAHFGLAAAWVLGAVLVLTVPWIAGAVAAPAALEGIVLAAAEIVSTTLCHSTDNPPAILAFLLAQAAIAVLVRRRWAWAEVVGLAGAAFSVFAWMDAFYRDARASDAYLLMLPVAGTYLAALLVRGLVRGISLQVPDAVTHLGTALFAWTVLFRVLYDHQPHALGVVSVGLAVLYLAAGLAALASDERDPRQVRVLLGLAAGFLTVAIPVQLGLHGITLAWAVEGVLLLWLGVRFESALARLGGYGVLALATLRLFVRHLPLHPGGFDPLFNPSFGTWLFVIAALGVAVYVTRDVAGEEDGPDRVLRPLLAGVALVLLFGLLTGETSDTFHQQAARAERRGDAAAAEDARRVGGLAVSVLWTVFATSLLAGGLGLRSHALFYSAYGLFALTAAKVVVWDLASFSIGYRMLAFLALALLLMAGAYLNLRFRERMADPQVT